MNDLVFPRHSHADNGFTDTGVPINPNQRCPNCNSPNYAETISSEYCPDCGLRCDYWGAGANDVYEAYCERERAKERANEQARWDQIVIDDRASRRRALFGF